jgi:outer membrane protein assembly factor BamD
MAFKTAKLFSVALLISAIFGLSACGGNIDESERWNEAQLYKESKSAMKRGEFTRAVKRLETLEARYPFGDYSLQGQLDLMYSYQRAGIPDDAISTAKRFLRLNPTHPRTDYAYYIQGMAEFDRHKSLLAKWFPRDRSKYDQQVMENSYEAFYQLAVRNPNSPYAADARQRMVFLKNKLAEACIDSVDWYMRREAFLASAQRAQQCIQRYDGAVATEQALDAMNASYKKLGMSELIQAVNKTEDNKLSLQ